MPIFLKISRKNQLRFRTKWKWFLKNVTNLIILINIIIYYLISTLAIYPKLMGDLDDGQAYSQGLNQDHLNQNNNNIQGPPL